MKRTDAIRALKANDIQMDHDDEVEDFGADTLADYGDMSNEILTELVERYDLSDDGRPVVDDDEEEEDD